MSFDSTPSTTEELTLVDIQPQERTIGQLVARATEDMSALIRAEIALAKTEVQFSVTQAGLGGVFFAIAAFFGVVAFILLMITVAYALVAVGLKAWAAFLIVTILLLIGAGIFAFMGKKHFSKVRPPERSIKSAQETIDTLKSVA